MTAGRRRGLASRQSDRGTRDDPHSGHRPGHDLEPGDRLRRRAWRWSPRAQEEFPQHFPQSGWVEHDPADIWSTDRRHLPRRASSAPGSRPATSPRSASPTSARPRWSGTAPPASRSAAPSSGRTAAPAALCAELRAAGHEPMVTERTGLLLDPYFSGTKLKWLLDAHDGRARRARARGELLFGTVDSCLIWKLTGGRGARHRRHQRRAHAALQHPRRRLGPGHLRAARRADGDAAGGPRLRRRLRRRPAPTSSAARSRSSASPATSRRRPSARPASRPAC